MRRVSWVLVLAMGACQTGVEPGGMGDERPMKVGKVVLPTELPASAPVTPAILEANQPVIAGEVAAPFSLTASDGSGLVLTRVDAKAVVQGPLAFTELHLYFKNPESRVREGTFAITLPRGAAVSRFAMEIDGKFQEAEVVEKSVARRVYDDFLHRRQDPALLEKGAGNQFTARVFPIPASGEKHLVLSFSQELAGQRYALPLRGLPEVARVDAEIRATGLDGKAHVQTLAQAQWRPDRDFVTDVPATAAAVGADGLVVASLVVGDNGGLAAPMPPQQVTLLVDTSASRALGFARYVDSIRELVAALPVRYGADVTVRVVAFDQETAPIFDGRANAYGDAQSRALLARGALGASDLAQALATTATNERLVIVTDGVLTAGGDTPALVDALKGKYGRVDVVLAGGIRDEAQASALVRSGTAAGDVFDLDRGAGPVAVGLGEPVLVDVPVQVAGASWVYPEVLPSARPGTQVLVMARLEKPSQAVVAAVGGPATTIGLGSATSALVERAVAGAEIAGMDAKLGETKDADAAKKLRAEIAAKSISARVISSQTSMLVLETEADYARYQIERTALADILTIGPNGLEQTKRTQIAAAPPPTPEEVQAAVARARDARARAETARELASASARVSGVVDSAAVDQGDAFSSLTGTGDISAGFDEVDIQGGLLGQESGAYGFGRAGVGPGGGGTGESTIGTGRYGTIGHGSGTGSGYGVGGGRGGMRGRTSAVPSTSLGSFQGEGGLDRAIIRRYFKRNIARMTYCYEKELYARPTIGGSVTVRYAIDAMGHVTAVAVEGFDTTVAQCITGVIQQIEFPHNRTTTFSVGSTTLTFRPSAGSANGVDGTPTGTVAWTPPAIEANPNPPPPEPEPAPESEPTREDRVPDDGPTPGSMSKLAALTGKLADVMTKVKAGKLDAAAETAQAWRSAEPGDVLALIAMGEVFEARNDLVNAARAYGSIIDLYPSRADFRRFAGERLGRLGKLTQPLVVDTYRRAVADRPDHVTGHRLLAFALLRSGDAKGAFEAILAGLDHKYPDNRFAGVDRLLPEDAGIIGAAYVAAGGPRAEVVAELTKRSATLATAGSTRFILYWETDANDVDFHIRDARGGHAWYSERELPSGGELYADVTTGYGPECFAIKGTPKAAPYKLEINYYSQGPMGYGMGLLQIQRFDGKQVSFEDRPYVIMTDGAYVDLGSYKP